jgi:hypothetical protein
VSKKADHPHHPFFSTHHRTLLSISMPAFSGFKRAKLFGLLVLILGGVLCGCAGTLPRQWAQPAGPLPAAHELDSVPFYSQKAYQCGPAALAMVLNWSDIEIDPDTLTPEVYTPSQKGSLQPAMIGSVRRHGRLAYPISGAGALLAEIASGNPVIVLQNLGFSWYPVWHYAVVIGYDLNRQEILMHSGTSFRQTTSLRVFERTWTGSDYWGLLVLLPTRLPARVTEQNYLSAVLGLEKARQWEAAVQGYQTAINRWPDNLAAPIGLSNSYYARGQLPLAEATLREASTRFPREGIIFNNLAQVLYEQGKYDQALEAARRAVGLGGVFIDEFRRTLEEIKAGKKE